MQIIGFLILLIIFFAILSIDKERLGSRQKGIIIGTLLALVIVGVGYEFIISKNTESKREMVLHFSQGGSLTCKGMEVDSKRFNYENGTASFIAKEGFPEIRGTVIPLSDCEATK